MTVLTGVFQRNHIDWLEEDIPNNCIELAWEEHLATCDDEYHDRCGFDDDGSGTYLLGFKQVKRPEQAWFETGMGHKRKRWGLDRKAEFSAIVREDVVQVVRSIWHIRGHHCSPCYPNQVDGDTPGFLIGYSLPPDMWDDNNPDAAGIKKRIRKARRSRK